MPVTSRILFVHMSVIPFADCTVMYTVMWALVLLVQSAFVGTVSVCRYIQHL